MPYPKKVQYKYQGLPSNPELILGNVIIHLQSSPGHPIRPQLRQLGFSSIDAGHREPATYFIKFNQIAKVHDLYSATIYFWKERVTGRVNTIKRISEAGNEKVD